MSLGLQMVKSHKPWRIGRLHWTKYHSSILSISCQRSFLVLRSREIHRLFSKGHLVNHKHYWDRSQQSWGSCQSRVANSRASNHDDRCHSCECIQFRRRAAGRFWSQPSRASAGVILCNRTILHWHSIPWSGTIQFLSRLSDQFQIQINTGWKNDSLLTSYNWITFGWRTFFRIFISREILSMSFRSLILAFSRILMATLSFVRMCSAIFTFPNVPFPSDLPKTINMHTLLDKVKYMKGLSWSYLPNT